MPAFVNEEHRRKWTAAIRRSWAKRRSHVGPEFSKAKDRYLRRATKDALESGADLGRRVPDKPHLNGEFDAVMSYLRVERVRANDRITQLDNAINALGTVKAAAK